MWDETTAFRHSYSKHGMNEKFVLDIGTDRESVISLLRFTL